MASKIMPLFSNITDSSCRCIARELAFKLLPRCTTDLHCRQMLIKMHLICDIGLHILKKRFSTGLALIMIGSEARPSIILNLIKLVKGHRYVLASKHRHN